jgi:hypothetical protein
MHSKTTGLVEQAEKTIMFRMCDSCLAKKLHGTASREDTLVGRDGKNKFNGVRKGHMNRVLLVDDGHDKIIFNAKVLLLPQVTQTSVRVYLQLIQLMHST